MDDDTRKKADAVLDAFDKHPGLLKAVLARLEDRRIAEDKDKGYCRGVHHGIAEALHKWNVKHQMRPDWHEPDEQDVDASVVGTRLDNAMGHVVSQKAIDGDFQEIVVEIFHRPNSPHVPPGEADDYLDINLAHLLALATRYYRDYLDRD